LLTSGLAEIFTRIHAVIEELLAEGKLPHIRRILNA